MRRYVRKRRRGHWQNGWAIRTMPCTPAFRSDGPAVTCIWTAAKMDNAMVKRHMRLAVGMTGVYGDYTTAKRLKPYVTVCACVVDQEPAAEAQI